MTNAIPEGNRTVTLHNQSWDQILSLLRRESLETGNPTPDTIANTIEAQGVGDFEDDEPESDDQPRFAIGFCGLPGSGKTTVSETAANMTEDTVALSMGDAIRDVAPDDVRGSSEKLGEFAAGARSQDPESIPTWLCDLAAEHDEQYFLVDGVRSVTDYEVLDEYFEGFVLVDVQADFYTRLTRLQDRGREGEAEFSATDLLSRDAREYEELGYRELLDFEYGGEEYLPNLEYTEYDMGLIDVEMVNDGGLSELREYVGMVLSEVEFFPSPEMALKQE